MSNYFGIWRHIPFWSEQFFLAKMCLIFVYFGIKVRKRCCDVLGQISILLTAVFLQTLLFRPWREFFKSGETHLWNLLTLSSRAHLIILSAFTFTEESRRTKMKLFTNSGSIQRGGNSLFNQSEKMRCGKTRRVLKIREKSINVVKHVGRGGGVHWAEFQFISRPMSQRSL